ncbi:MAG TPA: hypothetical protein PK826_07580 [Anaerolineae bacterium]|nr:hypothetical protein [Anaerolineae bacterium]
MSKATRRQEWFDRGVQALVSARPGAPSLYCCPLCIRGFDTANPHLSLEDVPPKNAGGRPLLLTCKKCNNTHGSGLDHHIKAGRELQEILEGTREIRGYIRSGDKRMAVKGTVFGENNALRELEGKSNPPERNAVEESFKSLVGTNAMSQEIHVEFSLKYNEWRERVAWLRVAYLYLTAYLGYTFVLRDVMNPIREQLDHPDEKRVPQVIKKLIGPIPEDCMVSVSSPAELRSFAVKLKRWIFFFPGFVDTDSFYERLAMLPEKGMLSVSGGRLELPSEPMFLCDFHLDYAQYLAFEQAGRLGDGV